MCATADEYLAGFESFAHLIRTIIQVCCVVMTCTIASSNVTEERLAASLQIIADTAPFMVVLSLFLAAFAVAFYSLFSHSGIARASTYNGTAVNSSTQVFDVIEFEETQTNSEDIQKAYGSIPLAILSTYRML